MSHKYQHLKKHLSFEKIVISVAVILFSVWIYSLVTKEKREFQAALEANNMGRYELFLSEYPESDYRNSVYNCMYQLVKEDGHALLNLHQTHPEMPQSIDILKDGLYLCYEKAKTVNTLDGWDNFMTLIKELPNDEYYEKIETLYLESEIIQEAISAINEYIQEGKEQKIECMFALGEEIAWEAVIAEKTIPYCKKYIEYFPKGKHIKECNKLLIDLEIDEILSSGEYGELPPMEKSNLQTDAINRGYSIIEVFNNTPYTLTILYGGTVESKSLVIPPEKKKNIRLLDGKYKIVASVDAPNVSNYAGEEILNGDLYESEYYISYGYDYRKHFNFKNIY
ncbi:MAG: hypothetical protein LBP85_01320 [Prevotellaceae bacterium]|nr:hypothetical protein [Prevotellaceae bacterium]